MLPTVIFILLAVSCSLAYYIMRQPDIFRVTRSAKINANPDAIYPWMCSPKKAAEWSPFVKGDPDGIYDYEGPDSGVGAITTWSGKKSGAGKLTVTGTVPNERVTMRLEFYKPMVCTNTVDYTLVPDGAGGTTVSWTMYGPNTTMGKLMSLFMNCEKMCGDQFEAGLRNLKDIVEGTQMKDAA